MTLCYLEDKETGRGVVVRLHKLMQLTNDIEEVSNLDSIETEK